MMGTKGYEEVMAPPRRASLSQRITAVCSVIIALCCITTLALVVAFAIKTSILVGSDNNIMVNARSMMDDTAHMLHTARVQMDTPEGDVHRQVVGLMSSTHRFLSNLAPLLESINPEAVHNTTTWLGSEEARPSVEGLADRVLVDLERAEDFLLGITRFLARVRVDE